MFQPSTSAASGGTLTEPLTLDGYLEAGTAAGVDPTLAETDKVRGQGSTARKQKLKEA
jgi:hypothetical protein